MADIFAAAGLQKPDMVRGMPQKNLAVELLQKPLRGELATRWRKNMVQARAFAKTRARTIRRDPNRAFEAALVIGELIALAREMREANGLGDTPGRTEEDLAFYDALETNDSAVKVLETLRRIARELVKTVRENINVDWTLLCANSPKRPPGGSTLGRTSRAARREQRSAHLSERVLPRSGRPHRIPPARNGGDHGGGKTS